MSTPDPQRVAAIKAAIAGFLQQRLIAKVEKLKEDDPKRFELQAQFVPSTWLEDATRRVGQIQTVTHSLKPVHPDAKGSSLFCEPTSMPALAEVGSHTLGTSFDADVVGNAAALDVYKFLKLNLAGRSLMELAISGDPDFGSALSEDPAQARNWMSAFASLAEPRGNFASHTLAKQIYWPIGDDPHDDSGFHILATLHPTSLVHRVYQQVQLDRFSDEAKAARAARKSGDHHERPVREYPNLAIQKLGGTKPQNISQLNSERRGDNLLLASLPPVWQSASSKPLQGVDSLFKSLGRRKHVRSSVAQLRHFLDNAQANNEATRRSRDDLVGYLIDELLQLAGELGDLEPGWSNAAQCALPPAHRAWLDPEGYGSPVDDAADRVAADFANWLNAQLRDPLAVGDPEFFHWRKLAREQFKQEERGTSHGH